MTDQKKLEVIEEAFNYYNDRTSLTSKEEKELLNLVNELYAAISVTRCCETLKDKKKITFDEWLGKWNWERIGSSYTFKRGESYTDAESLMISYKKEYSL